MPDLSVNLQLTVPHLVLRGVAFTRVRLFLVELVGLSGL
jgi:hypothetical protein